MFDWPEQIQTSPDEHVVERDRVLALDGQRVRPAGRQRVERDRPLAVGAGLGRLASGPAIVTVTSSPGSAQPQTRSF